MDKLARAKLTRRQVHRLALVLPAPLALAALGGRTAGIALAQEGNPTAEASPEGTPTLAPTPSCVDDDDLDETLEQTEGPFYTPDTPERTSLLEPGITGTKLTVSGYVYSTACAPIPGALLDFWHADDNGVYDNEGFRLRGHQFADEAGRFELETILPGLYTGRTRHIHVKVQAPNQPVLTTQLYFPDEPANDADGIFHPDLVLDMQETGSDDEGELGFFTFVLDAA